MNGCLMAGEGQKPQEEGGLSRKAETRGEETVK